MMLIVLRFATRPFSASFKMQYPPSTHYTAVDCNHLITGSHMAGGRIYADHREYVGVYNGSLHGNGLITTDLHNCLFQNSKINNK